MKVSVVIPAYNEAENLPVVAQRVAEVMAAYPADYEILFVNDGSSDNSLEVLRGLVSQNLHIRYLSFSRNFGHQTALRAGLDHATGDAVISIDADLQHPPELLPGLIAKWQEGFDIVYTLREADPTQGFVKKQTSRWFYRIINYAADIELQDGAADFRLLDKKVVAYLRQFKENELFLRGVISWIGFNQASITYKPAERFAGTTKYSFKKMVRLAGTGITSFTTKPLYLSVLLGFLMFLFSMGFGLVSFYDYWRGAVVAGWTSTIIIIVLIGGIQLIMMGIIGIYLGKMFNEVKQRPPYLIQEFGGMISNK